jgi:nucleoside-diphosphate-sugar epimerase
LVLQVKALVTGSAGFVGRHVVDALRLRGWDVEGCDPELRPGSAMIEIEYDAVELFRDYEFTTRYDLVIHAAASAPHRAAIDNEHGHMARNLMLDAAMFDWAVRTKQHRVIYLSSSAAYPVALQGDTAWTLREDDIDLDDCAEPDSVYGWVKLTGERLAREARQDGLNVTVVRPFSGYGEDQSPNFPFRAILDRVKGKEDPVCVWGDGTQVRDWIHISDVVTGMLAIAENGTEEPVNLGTGVGTSMFDLALKAASLAGHTAMVKAMPDKPTGVHERVADMNRMRRIYVPRVSLEEGIIRALRT